MPTKQRLHRHNLGLRDWKNYVIVISNKDCLDLEGSHEKDFRYSDRGNAEGI